ncbi:MAG: hypothetical protein IKE20_07140, partial [Eggerthellaceae bacterium]|nr:hypothetical protein [Eggerthellaceae bacterium]
MTKRRTDGLGIGRNRSEDSPTDIDGAFAPTKGRQSVEYDVDDQSIGLTQAFGAIVPEEEPEYGWDDGRKWKDFDWNASFGDADEDAEQPEAFADESDETAFEEAEESVADSSDAEGPGEVVAASTVGTSSTHGQASSGRGRHAAPTAEDSPRMRRSQRMRRSLIVLIVLLLVGLCALGFFMYRTFTESQEQAVQQTQEQTASSKDSISAAAADDAAAVTAKQADVPDLSAIMGKTQDEAIAILKRGAQVTATQPVADEGSVIKSNVTVSLTSEPADSRTASTPTVYLGLNADGVVVQAGYSASASALGFGTLSFADAVTNERVIEKTLQKIGVGVPNEVVSLPENKDDYSTYASDGTTVVKERCSFEGTATVNA